MQKKPDFQTIFMTLQNFWADKGCLIWQPYYQQVGAGTMNPATFLRVLGPEPWNVAYVEPSIRPDDGRYGDNPYRMQQHYQFQVILKPDPGNPQELYLESLQALGIDPLEHDIRFVEDNWESPALGAWGLGWEVWLDGQEITQFTYFQQAGGINLEPVSVELTYGMERIAMAMQGSYNFRKIQWAPRFTYGDVNYMAEKEHSTYYFEAADIDRLRAMYDLFEKEADLALEKGLILPAHDYILKCSHTFNVLDTRGAIGVTERQALFGRMRDLSRRSAEAYVAQREEMGFPWLEKPAVFLGASQKDDQSKDQLPLPSTEKLAQKGSYLLEIGTEELPAADLTDAISQFETGVPAMFDDLRLSYEKIEIISTPRRLAAMVSGLSSRQDDQTSELKGPPANRAFDENGKPTKAAIGFARSKGLDVSALEKKEIDGGEYLVATVFQEGKSIAEILPEKLVEFVSGIRFNKSMRWNASKVAFSRPIRWLVSMFEETVIPFSYAELTASAATRGLRFTDKENFTLRSADKFFTFLESQNIIRNTAERRKVIKDQVASLLQSVNASTQINESLLDEVTNLVEAPTALLGNFSPSHLELPPEVLVGVMKKHQRYFPVYDEKGKLMPYFITVRNGGKEHLDIVARGNEEVIEARFADAAFFMKEDSRRTLEEFLPKLESLTFHPKLGSMRAKSERVEKMTESVCDHLGLDDKTRKTALRAARLCKADLVTNMVVEMTALQGTIGKYYALRDGETKEIATAIEEHYQPRQAGGASPNTNAALAVGIADRLDSLVGLFAVNMAPTGTKDPFGLRRAAIGLVQNLMTLAIDYDLREGIANAAKVQPVDVDEQTMSACVEFITSRLQNMLLDEGYKYDVVNAVLARLGHNPALAIEAVKALEAWTVREEWETILPAFSRCVRITRDLKESYAIKKEKLAMEEEKELLKAAENAQAALAKSATIDTFLEQVKAMMPAINTFFDNVLVMDKDQAVKENRLAILQKISNLSENLADLSELEGF